MHEDRICQNCKVTFTIEPEDFVFYEKMKVPPPTWCPSCREQCRLAFRNERTYYQGECALCTKTMVSLYAPGRDRVVYCQACYYSDKWDPRTFGRDVDFSRTFTEQFSDLLRGVPRVGMLNSRSENCEYTQFCADNKDSYLLVQSSNNDRVHHSYWMNKSTDCIDCSFDLELERCYECVSMERSYRCFYSNNSEQCFDSYFLRNCQDCHNCFGCINLRHREYCVFNEQKTKEEYIAFLASQQLDTWSGTQKARAKVEEFILGQPRRFAEITTAEGCSGNHIKRAKDCVAVFGCYDAEHCRYGTDILRNVKDCMDVNACARDSELVYESINSLVNAYNCRFTSMCRIGCSNLTYCDHCQGADESFGCASLKAGMRFCIFNKEYDESEYYGIKERLIEHMKATGEWGIFFVPQLSSFGYNETNAQEWYPLKREEAIAKGFHWEDQQTGTYGKETIAHAILPNSIRDVPPSIIQEVLACEQCSRNYKIIRQEQEFYWNNGVPVPRQCPDCRFSARQIQRGPHQLWSRQCQCEGEKSLNGVYKNTTRHGHGDTPCLTTFETTYNSARQEIIYCAECYQTEVV